MDQFYYDSGYTDDSYFVYIAEAELTGGGTASISCDASVIAGGVAVFGYGDIETFASITCTISHIEGADLFAFSEATLAAQVDRIRDVNLEASASFSTAIDAVRGIYVSAQADSAFDFAIANLRVRTNEAAVDAAFSLAASAGLVKQLAADLTSSTELAASAELIKETTADISATAEQTATAEVSRGLAAAISATNSLTALIGSIKPADAAITSTAGLTASGNYKNKRPWVVAANSDTSFNSSTKAVGTHSLLLNSVNSYAYYPTASNFRLPAGGTDFIIELFFNASGSIADKLIVSSGTNATSWAIRGDTSGKLTFTWFDTGNVAEQVIGGTYTLTYPAWHYIRVQRVGTAITLAYSKLTGSTWSSITTVGSGTSLYQGKLVTDTAGLIFGDVGGNSASARGYYDEFYMASGTTTGGQAFASMGSRLTSGKNDSTLALLHFDNDFVDDFTGLALAQAAITSQSAISAQVNKQATASASISAASSVTANLSAVQRTAAALSAQGFVMAASGRIQAETADLDSQFVVTAEVSKVRNVDASLTASSSMSVLALDVDLAEAAITCTSSVTIEGTRLLGIVKNLTATSSLSATVDPVALTLYYNAGGSGYITSTYAGTQIATWTEAPVHTNFMMKLETGLTSGQEVKIYSSGSHQVTLSRKSDGYFAGTDTYWIVTSSVYQTGTAREFAYGAYFPANQFDPTQWHNYHMPLRMFDTDGTESYPLSAPRLKYIIGQNFKIDGQSPSLYGGEETVNLVTLSSGPGDSSGPAPRGADSGQWGHTSNPVTLHLDAIWVKKNTLDDNSLWIDIPASDFYNSNGARLIHNGLTPSGIQGQVWLPFRNLLDQSSTAPAWNYTAVNSVAYGIIKYASASISSSSAFALTPTKIKSNGATLSAQVTLVAGVMRRQQGAATINTSASLTASLSKAAMLESSMSTAVTAQIQAVKTTDVSLSAEVTASQATSTANSRIRSSAVALPVTTVQSTTASITRTVESNQFVQANLSAEPLRIKGTSINLTVSGSELVVAAKTGQGLIHMDSPATMSATAEKITDTPVAIDAEVSVTSSGNKFTSYSADITSTANLTASVDYLRRNEVIMQSTASLTANAVKTVRTQATANTQASVQAVTSDSRIVRISSSMSSAIAVTAQNDTLRRTSASLTATTEAQAVPGIYLRTEANLEVNGFVLATGRKITFDRYLQLKIKPESRTLVVLEESRLITIDAETRVNKIKGYPL